jgi:hypothetical protein
LNIASGNGPGPSGLYNVTTIKLSPKKEEALSGPPSTFITSSFKAGEVAMKLGAFSAIAAFKPRQTYKTKISRGLIKGLSMVYKFLTSFYEVTSLLSSYSLTAYPCSVV